MGAPVSMTGMNEERVKPFLDALRASGFTGDIAADAASRTVYSTDNSIYQRPPAAILFPRNGEDVQRVVKAAASYRMPVTPRGGGTGTNGQSLTSGVIVDCSRHMNRVLAFDRDARTITVEPGMVLDQLNAFLKPHGLFFPPTVSTASRATIGGMIATDASGKGSRIYGRTSDYVESLDVVLSDGTTGIVQTEDLPGLQRLAAEGGRLAIAAGRVLEAVERHRNEIEAVFPKMNRGLTGYNLLDVKGSDGRLRLQKLLAGSEGTLAFTRAATLRLVPRPAFRAIAVLRYASFRAALDDIARLLGADPAAIEIMDDKVLALAQEDVVWASLEKVLGGASDRPVAGLNVVEFVGDTKEEVEAQLERLASLPASADQDLIDQITVREQALVATVWDLRKKAVGLLGRLGGIPFIEDTAVPPESLPAYVGEFRGLLDAHGLDYGMFGHADVGCLHVRPVLDMRNPDHAALIRPLSDAVAALAKRYGGLLWGEHGRGVRGEYSPLFFGPELTPVLSRIKAAFDPANLFNPGKLAVPAEGLAVDRIDGVPFRGEFDRQIDASHADRFGKAVACNGNGACHGWDAFDLMCPSYKATRDRNQSPKGRAALLREWARRRSTGEDRDAAFPAFEEEVKAALDTCLSCKACASLCPVKVDIPAMRAEFFAAYYGSRKRPRRHRALGHLETALVAARRLPALSRALSRSKLVATVAEKTFGLVDLPAFHAARKAAAHPVGPTNGRPVVLLEDLFTSSFDGQSVEAAEALLVRVGYRVTRRPARPNGKAQQVLGLLAPFRAIAEARLAEVDALAEGGIPVLTLDAATGLMFADDYAKSAGRAPKAKVLPIEQFLVAELEAGRIVPSQESSGGRLTLLTHCTERAARPLTPKHWERIFAAFGVSLETPATGCCGMAGMFGHEKEHKSLSETLFRMSWQPILDRAEPNAVLASGFSCRCQTERFGGFRPRHPAEALLEAISGAAGPLRPHGLKTGDIHAE